MWNRDNFRLTTIPLITSLLGRAVLYRDVFNQSATSKQKECKTTRWNSQHPQNHKQLNKVRTTNNVDIHARVKDKSYVTKQQKTNS